MGLHPKLQCLNNEASHALQDHLMAEGIDYQLVPLHCISTATTPQKEPSAPSRTTSLLAFAAQTRIFPSTSGTDCSCRQSYPSTSSLAHASILACWLGCSYMAHSTSIASPLHCQAFKFLCMKNPLSSTHEHHMARWVGIWDQN